MSKESSGEILPFLRTLDVVIDRYETDGALPENEFIYSILSGMVKLHRRYTDQDLNDAVSFIDRGLRLFLYQGFDVERAKSLSMLAHRMIREYDRV